MMANPTHVAQPVDVDTDTLRKAIQDEYKEVAKNPGKGFHFHTGRTLTKIVGYKDDWFDGVSESAIEAFAGTGNPFTMGTLTPGENSTWASLYERKSLSWRVCTHMCQPVKRTGIKR